MKKLFFIPIFILTFSSTLGEVAVFPVLAIDPNIQIPSFFVLNRQYLEVGHSVAVRMKVEKNGRLTKATGETCPPTEMAVAGAECVFPSANWKVRLEGWSASGDTPDDPAKLIYRLNVHDAEKTFMIPSWALTFGPSPVYYDNDRDQFYFTVEDGPTGDRTLILLRFDLVSSTLEEIGKTWDNPRLSPDHKWLLYFPGALKEIGGKRVVSQCLSIFSIQNKYSLEITKGVICDKFCGWDVDSK